MLGYGAVVSGDTPRDPPEVLERFNAELDLPRIIARQLSKSAGLGTAFDDLVAFGREGLLEAARRYDPARGVPFRAFASFRVRGAMIDGIRSFSELPRRVHARLKAIDAASGVSEGAAEDLLATTPGAPPATSTPAAADRLLSDHLAAMATAMATGLVADVGLGEAGEATAVNRHNPEQEVQQAELLSLLRSEVATLPEPENELVERHYFNGERFDHVAADLGLSKSWASRLHTRAVQRLTKRLRSLE